MLFGGESPNPNGVYPTTVYIQVSTSMELRRGKDGLSVAGLGRENVDIQTCC